MRLFLLALGLVATGCVVQSGNDRQAQQNGQVESRPIEVLFSSGTRSSGYYTVKGLVRNPGSGVLENVDLYCKLVDKDGRVLGFGQHLIDVSRLALGGESAFHVSVEYDGPSQAIDGYRLSFQTLLGERLEVRDAK